MTTSGYGSPARKGNRATVIKRTAWQRYFTGIYVIWLREVKRFWRDTPRRIGSFFQPLVYLLLLGTGLQSAFKVFGSGTGTRYIVFMFPGILGMTLLFTSVFSAISILWDREFGFLKEVLVSPVPRSSVALGKVVGGATTSFMQGVILMALMFAPGLYGFSWATLRKFFLLLPVVLLVSLGLTSLGVAIAANMKSFEGFPVVMNFILLPLFFLSGAMFPLQGLPKWMEVLTRVNPLSYGVDLLRGIALKGIDLTQSGFNVAAALPRDLLSRIPPDVINYFRQQAAGGPRLQAQVHPAWLDVLVMILFGLVMSFIAVLEFTRQD